MGVDLDLLARRQLADYDRHEPGTVFTDAGLELTIEEAYRLQIRVAALREQRGERVAGYKIGCVSEEVRRQLGLAHSVFGHIFASELHPSGARLDGHRYRGLAVEGERGSWAGMCPGNHESAGKRHSGKRRKGNEHLQPILVETAWSAVRADGYLKALYHRHATKRGGYRSATAKKKAIIVVAHAMLIIVWHVLATGRPYQELGAGYFTTRLDPDKETRRLIAKLQALGHKVNLEPAA